MSEPTPTSPNISSPDDPAVGDDSGGGGGTDELPPVGASASGTASRPTSTATPTSSATSWENRLSQLRDFRDQTGHTNVPNKYAANPQLATWVAEQRRHYKALKKDSNKKTSLTEDRIATLDAIGFQWSVQDSTWEGRLRELQRYRDEFGNCNVPNKWKANPSLGKWVNSQRQYYRQRIEGKKSSLTEERIQKMEALGFVWSLRDLTPWEQRLAELKEYKARHGHCVIPQKDKTNPQLARWVDTQRQQHRLRRDGKPSQLTDERVAKLEEVGMKWVVSDFANSWERRYEELREYKAEHGDCNVPMRKDNPQLGEWVGQQRKQYKIIKEGKKAALTEERIQKLDQLEFTWSLRKRKRQGEKKESKKKKVGAAAVKEVQVGGGAVAVVGAPIAVSPIAAKDAEGVVESVVNEMLAEDDAAGEDEGAGEGEDADADEGTDDGARPRTVEV